jgi:hypothetical protein
MHVVSSYDSLTGLSEGSMYADAMASAWHMPAALQWTRSPAGACSCSLGRLLLAMACADVTNHDTDVQQPNCCCFATILHPVIVPQCCESMLCTVQRLQ